jgi:hypothetical protein
MQIARQDHINQGLAVVIPLTLVEKQPLKVLALEYRIGVG